MILGPNEEKIFAYAEGLDRSGRQKNIIGCWGKTIYIVNADKTVLLRFELTEEKFPEPFAFYASDYDSPQFEVEDGAIVFIQTKANHTRKKRCKAPNQIPKDMEDLFYKFYVEDSFQYYATLNRDITDLLNESLSHIEFLVNDSNLTMVQRDIFSGTILEIEKTVSAYGFGLVKSQDELPDHLNTLGMRTNDLLTLFTFNDKIKLYIPDSQGYFVVEGQHGDLLGIVAGCLYDDIGKIKNLKEPEDGRKEQKIRSREPQINPTDQGQLLRKRRQ